MDETLRTIIDRMPGWSTASDLAITPLSGGISNQNYRLSVHGESFVVRVCGKDTELLGVDRQSEHASNVIAAETGVAPEVLAFFPDLGSIVTRFIDGRKLPPGVIDAPEHLQRVGSSIRRLHGARPFPSQFSAFRAAREYKATAESLRAQLPPESRGQFDMLASIESALYSNVQNPFLARPCHNDLLNENFLDDGEIRIIDYEYAGMGDPFFDLGNFAAHHQLDDAQIGLLAAAYFGAETNQGQVPAMDVAIARIRLMMMVSDLREALWGAVQTRLSTLDFDYQAYADKHFARFDASSSSRRTTEWLDTVLEAEHTA